MSRAELPQDIPVGSLWIWHHIDGTVEICSILRPSNPLTKIKKKIDVLFVNMTTGTVLQESRLLVYFRLNMLCWQRLA